MLPISGKRPTRPWGTGWQSSPLLTPNQRKLVSEFSITLCQNESKTKESIKEAEALCACSIREAEANCAHSIKEAEAHCSTAVREAETRGASQVSSIQQSYARGIQQFEEEAIEEESKGQLNFLSTCQATLEASPLKSCGMLIASYQVLLGHTLMSHLFSIPEGASPSQQGSTPEASFPSAHTAPRPSSRAQAVASLTRPNGYLTFWQSHFQGNS